MKIKDLNLSTSAYMHWGNETVYIASTSLWYYCVLRYFYISIVIYHLFQLHFSFSFRHIQLDIQILLYLNLTLHLGTEPLNEDITDFLPPRMYVH